jgi:CheY-like chemotaxis protein
VHGIVKSCNGTIRVESTLGEGSCFDVYLPRIETEPLRELEEESPLPIGKERILFVDDEKLQTELAEEALSQLGYDVTTFTDSTRALEQFIKQPDYWDLLVTDMAMPDMAGDILGRQIKSIRPDMPMLICTGYSENLNEERARQIGFSGFVLKPLITKDMARLIRGILDQSPEDKVPASILRAQ